MRVQYYKEVVLCDRYTKRSDKFTNYNLKLDCKNYVRTPWSLHGAQSWK
jgi:hypothetical protein